jgi:FMN phosphatase YigB (HAD superfamily)
MKLHDFKVLTFDCYGTLIDWESGMVAALAPLTDKLDGRLTRDQILEAHARYESGQQKQTPYKKYRGSFCWFLPSSLATTCSSPTCYAKRA